MQIAVGIPLIIIGFLIPIALFLLYRWLQAKKAKDRILLGEGELFDKTGERNGLVEDGEDKIIPCPVNTATTMSVALANKSRFQKYKATVMPIVSVDLIKLVDANKEPKGRKYELMYFYSDTAIK